MMKKHFLSLGILFLSCLVSGAVSHPFHTRYTDTDGITDYNILKCSQDAFGRIWIATNSGVYFYTGNKFTPLRHSGYTSACSATTLSIASDPDGCVWISSAAGIGYYDIYSGSFTDIPELKKEQIRDIDIEDDGCVWLTSRNGIWKYSKPDGKPLKIVSADSFSPLHSCIQENGDLVFTTREGDIYFLDRTTEAISPLKRAGTDPAGNPVRYELIEAVRKGTVLASTSAKTVVTLDVYSGGESPVLSTSTPEYVSEITSLMVRNNEFWIGTRSGLLIYNVSTREIENQISGPAGKYSLNGMLVRCLMSDASGNVWAGTFNEGLYCWMNYRGQFNRYTADMYAPSMTGKSICSLCFDDTGRLWLGSEEGRINRFDNRTDTFQDFTKQTGIRGGTVITSITREDKRLWVTVFGDGLLALDPDSGAPVKRFHFQDDGCLSFAADRNSGDLFIGARNGLYRITAGTDTVREIPALDGRMVNCMLQDRFGLLWLGLYGRGIGQFDPATGSFRMMLPAEAGTSLVSGAISCLSQGEGNVLWAGTGGGGLCRIRMTDDGEVAQVRCFDEKDGLPSNSISAAIEDGKGRLWVSTSNGVACMDLATLTVLGNYLQNDKVTGSLFGSGSAVISEGGSLFLGTRNGLVSFNPEGFIHLFENKALTINNVTAGTLDVRQPRLEKGKSLINSNQIKVRQKDAPVLTVSYTSMIYDNPNTVRYACTLKKRGFSNQVVTTANHVSYMSLPPGKYDFSVKVAGASGPETESHREIIITAPWYRSIAAELCYLLLFLSGIWLALRFYLRYKEEQNRRKEELHEAKRQSDAFRDKMDFMANITHEIRTPVSLIAILVDKILGKDRSPVCQEELKSLKNNSNRLVELCNELLNFRRVQNNTSYILKTNRDLCLLVREAAEPFKDAAERKKIELRIEVPAEPVFVECDHNAVDCIISNLLSNAIKYGQTQVRCSLTREEGNAVFRIDSDGPRIPEEESELIFNAFYQSRGIESSGSGLGLTYSRTLAELHNGKLYLDTREARFNSFVFVLPISGTPAEELAAVPGPELQLPGPEEAPAVPDGRQRILVVEDNRELRELIRDELAPDYAVLTAANGQEAMDIIQHNGVDMVISDIMMPVMDGCELCNLIKSDIAYSHILVILLTAAIGVETHLRSLKAGVDSYIEKPFKMEVLKATIGNLLKNKEIRNEQFSSNPLAHVNFTPISAIEREFMEKLHSIVIEHISETEMTTTQLASMMAISRQALATKVRANTGLSTLEYIRICRLKKAAELLSERKYRVSEVAYLVGYTSPSYFTKHFQQQFKMTPSEFIQSNKE